MENFKLLLRDTHWDSSLHAHLCMRPSVEASWKSSRGPGGCNGLKVGGWRELSPPGEGSLCGAPECQVLSFLLVHKEGSTNGSSCSYVPLF